MNDPARPDACRRMNEVLTRVGDRWSIQIVYALGRGTMRFNEIKRELGITQRMLSQTLRDLERDGLVRRHQFATIPPRVDYELTDLGRTFREPVMALARWAFDNQPVIEANRRSFGELPPCAEGEGDAPCPDAPCPDAACAEEGAADRPCPDRAAAE